MADDMLGAAYVVGLDIGDGESALAWSSIDQVGPANVYQRQSTAETSILTALAPVRGQAGRYVFGEEALLTEDAVQFAVNFKERPVPGQIPKAVVFGQALLKEFFEANQQVKERCLVFVGHPVGWRGDVVEEYRLHLRHLSTSVYLLAESQSALVYVRDRGSGHPEDLGSVLVIDIGSSTVDITIVEDMIPTNIDVGLDLGCRQIDEQLADMAKKALAANPKFTAALTRSGGEDLLLLACRRTKEAQFAGREQSFPFSHRADLADIVHSGFGWLKDQEIPNIVMAPGGWRSRFDELIRRVRSYLAKPPKVVILTGGGSRMPFVRDICVQAFPDAAVDLDNDPSLSVTRGLVSAGRQRVQAARFRREVSAITTSPRTRGIIHRQVEAAYQASKKPTLEAMRNQDMSMWPRIFENPPGQAKIVDEFQRSVSAYLASKAQPICAKYGIDSSRFDMNLKLPQFFAEQLMERTRVKGSEQSFRETPLGQAYARAAVSAARQSNMRRNLEAIRNPRLRKTNYKQTAIEAAISLAIPPAVDAGKAALRWGLKAIERQARLRGVREAELPQQDAEQAINDTLIEIDVLLNGRADAVERFVT